MNIKTKLTVGFFTLITILCVVAVLGITALTGTFGKMNEMVNVEYKKIKALSVIRFDFNRKVKGSSYLILSESASEKREEINLLKFTEDDVDLAIEQLKILTKTGEGNRLLSEVFTKRNEYVDFIDKEIALIREGREQEAARLVIMEGETKQEEFYNAIINLAGHYEKNIETALNETESASKSTTFILIVLSIVGVILGVLISMWISKTVVKGLTQVSDVMKDFSSEEWDMSTRIKEIPNDEIGIVATSFNNMADTLEKQVIKELQISKENEERAWMMKSLADLTAYLQGSSDLESFSQNFIQKITPMIGGKHGVFYMNTEDDSQPVFTLTGTYAYKQKDRTSDTLKLGEGIIGQSALDKQAIMISEVPDDYIRIHSGIGEAKPGYIFAVPIVFEDQVRAVFEVASFQPFGSIEQELAVNLADYAGIIIDNISGRIKMMELLLESQTMSEELQVQTEELSTQHEELKQFNEQLEKQTQELIQSELVLQQQQEELEQSNVELEEKTVLLEEHNQKFEIKNKEVEKAKIELEEKATQLELTSKYKSEFLANMSHELRTPLNSMLILSKLLADNKSNNLSEKQVEYAKTINFAGSDLLELINDILDLAKVEARKLEANIKDVSIKEIIGFVQRNFNPIANDKGLEFQVVLENSVEESIQTDEKILQQILKNLIANAMKFTENGSVSLEISQVMGEDIIGNDSIKEDEKTAYIAFSVKDTGIGIPKDKQSIIFEAFQQVDGTTSRKYGGTGLGLSISREHASVLQGNIIVDSEEGKGSTFTLYVPVKADLSMNIAVQESAVARDEVYFEQKNDEVVEINNQNHRKDLDEMGKQTNRILVIEDNLIQRESIVKLIESNHPQMQLVAVSSGQEALGLLQSEFFDCAIVDLGLGDISGIHLLQKIRNREVGANIPIFVYTGKELSEREEMELKHFTDTIIIKGKSSHERLLEEITFFIRQKEKGTMFLEPPEAISNLAKSTEGQFFGGKKILIVDDDVRNVFALSSILEEYQMDVLFAENGKEALNVLKEHTDIDLILMDIMMPEMDGYEAITRIREMKQHKQLPIIALTAKAMKEDREKCIAVGASDYISKPIINQQLISLMRVWLYR